MLLYSQKTIIQIIGNFNLGYYTFAVKYMETQYRQSTAVSGVAVSLSSMFPLAIGMLLGGVIISVFKPKGYRFFIFLFLVELVSVFAFGSGLLLGCSPLKINGDLQDDGT